MTLDTRQIYTYGDSIYLLSEASSWAEAQAEAQSLGGNLVTINDGAEQTFLAGLFAGQTLWTGYSDADVEGSFQWADGDDSAYTHWAAGQPNNFRNEDFVILSGNGSWNDVAGNGRAQGIIEIKNPTTPILAIADLNIIEPTEGSQQAIFSVRRYGNSSSITTVNYSTADDTAAAGTNYTAASGTLTFAPGETEKTISVTINSDTDVTSGETLFLNLSTPTNAILGDNQAKVTILETTEAITFGGSTYVLTNPGNWGEAQEQARTFGGNLVTINSAEEQTFLAETYARQNLWIGYSDAGQEYDPTTQEGFKWIADTSAYTNWLAGQPNNFREEDFVILGGNGAWNDVGGTGNFRGIIEIPQASTPDTGEIQGIKWNDLNANGVRDSSFIGGDNPDIAFVIDVSDSTKNNLFAGSPVGDLNNDSLANTRLDAEIAGFLTLNQQLINLGLGDKVDVSIIAYGESAANADMNLVADDLQLSATPNADADGNGIADVEDILRSISVGAFDTGLATNPEAALQQVEKTFDGLGTADGDGNVIVLTDGEQTQGGDIADEVEQLLDRNANLKAFGVGNDAELEIIQTIDPDGVRFTSTDELLDAFNDLSNGGNSFIEPGLAGVTIYVDTNNNGILDAGEPTQISATDDPNTPDVDETGQYSFENLAPGTYTIREVVPTGFRQTFPNNGVVGNNLVLNGGFEDGPAIRNEIINVTSGSAVIPNWAVTDGQVDLVADSTYPAAAGAVSLDLNGYSTGEIQQTINTTVGERYLLTFDLAGNPGGTPTIKMGQVEVAGITADLTYDISGQSISSLDYVPTALEFTATDPQTVLKFKSLVPGAYGPNIDNVSVVKIAPNAGFHTVEIGEGSNVIENINFGNTAAGNNAPVITTDPVTELTLQTQPEQPEPVELSDWEVFNFDNTLGGPGGNVDSNWIVQPDNTTVVQSVNSNASVLLSDFELVNDQISGNWKVNTAGDDDFMGFVFGYQDPENFYLFDWKQRAQGDFGGFAAQGMSIKVVNADSPLTILDLGPTSGNDDRVETLYTNTIPWEYFAEYQFTLDFTPGEFTITVKEEESGSTLLSETIQDDTYTSGKFGFYNYSQGQVQYEGFTRQSILNGVYTYDVDATDADQDVLTYSLTQAPNGMEIDAESGLITWTPENISVGTQVPVTVLVDDGLGGNDQQSFIIEVVDANNPPSQADTPGLQTLVGTDGRDTLTGTENDDTIIGKGGSDRLTGNGGADQFVSQSIDDRIDRINDFEVGSDKIVLSDLVDSLGISLDSYDQAINQGYLEITSFGQDDSRIRIDIDGLNGNRGARTLAIAYDVTPAELDVADNFVI